MLKTLDSWILLGINFGGQIFFALAILTILKISAPDAQAKAGELLLSEITQGQLLSCAWSCITKLQELGHIEQSPISSMTQVSRVCLSWNVEFQMVCKWPCQKKRPQSHTWCQPRPSYGPLTPSSGLSTVRAVTRMVGVQVTILVTVLVFEISEAPFSYRSTHGRLLNRFFMRKAQRCQLSQEWRVMP